MKETSFKSQNCLTLTRVRRIPPGRGRDPRFCCQNHHLCTRAHHSPARPLPKQRQIAHPASFQTLFSAKVTGMINILAALNQLLLSEVLLYKERVPERKAHWIWHPALNERESADGRRGCANPELFKVTKVWHLTIGFSAASCWSNQPIRNSGNTHFRVGK